MRDLSVKDAVEIQRMLINMERYSGEMLRLDLDENDVFVDLQNRTIEEASIATVRALPERIEDMPNHMKQWARRIREYTGARPSFRRPHHLDHQPVW